MNAKQVVASVSKLLPVIRAEQVAASEKLSRCIGKNADKTQAVATIAETKVGNGAANFVRSLPANSLRELKKLESMVKRLEKLKADALEGKDIVAYVRKENDNILIVGDSDKYIDATVYKGMRFCAGKRDADEPRNVIGETFDALCRGIEFAGMKPGETFTIHRNEKLNEITQQLREAETFAFKPMVNNDGDVIGYTVTVPGRIANVENGKEYAERMKAEAEAALQAEAEAERVKAEAETVPA